MSSCFLYSHPTSKNRGCEATVLSTLHILNKTNPTNQSVVSTTRELNDKDLNIGLVSQRCPTYYVPPISFKKYIPAWRYIKINQKLVELNVLVAAQSLKFSLKSPLAKDFDVYLSIGGDNYCCGKPYTLFSVHEYMHKHKKKSVQWGCSIEPSVIDGEMIQDLKNYSLITTRETQTYQAF